MKNLKNKLWGVGWVLLSATLLYASFKELQKIPMPSYLEGKTETTIQEEIKQDSVPQVNNYQFDNLIGPVWRDPISNVYSPEQ